MAASQTNQNESMHAAAAAVTMATASNLPILRAMMAASDLPILRAMMAAFRKNRNKSIPVPAAAVTTAIVSYLERNDGRIPNKSEQINAAAAAAVTMATAFDLPILRAMMTAFDLEGNDGRIRNKSMPVVEARRHEPPYPILRARAAAEDKIATAATARSNN